MIDIVDANSATKLLPHLASYVAVVEAGSFSKAARRLGIDRTLLSRRVQTLEDGLGVRLLQRTTRQLAPTEAGRVLFDRAMSPLNETVAALSRAADTGVVEGSVRVASLPPLTEPLWVPVIRKLAAEHPLLRIDLRAGDRLIDLVDEGIDFALRTGNMPDSSFTARRVGSWRYILCASPEWLAHHGDRVRAPEDVHDHWLLYSRLPRADRWTIEREGHSVAVHTGAAVTVDNGTVLEQLLLAGIGVAALPTFVAHHHIESGALIRVLPEWSVAHGHGFWIVTPARDYVPLRVTIVMEAVRARLESLDVIWRKHCD